MDNHSRKAAVAMLSVVSNFTLVVLKLVVGILIGSVSVISEAIHSGVDLVAAVIALVAVRKASHPADRDHPFGHGKVENVSGTVEALLIFLAAVWIVYEAVKKLLHAEPLEAPGWGVAVMLLSATANIVVSRRLFRVGRETHSVALQADAWHLRTDVYTSAGVMAGLSAIWLGGRLLPGMDLRWVDPVAAIAVALLIVKAAYDLTVEAARDLLDVRLPEEEHAWLRAYLTGLEPPVLGFHCLRTRKSGAERFLDFHLLVSSDMPVGAAHDITDSVTADIQARFSGASVLIHVEPSDGDNVPPCALHCPLGEENAG